MKKILALVGIVLASAYLQGCASGATVAGMTSVKSFEASRIHMPEKIMVAAAEGGKATHPLGASQVGSGEFEDALVASLQANGLLAPDQGAYVLKPTLQKLVQPLLGLDLTVKADVLYVLEDSASGRELLNQTISSSHTASLAMPSRLQNVFAWPMRARSGTTLRR